MERIYTIPTWEEFKQSKQEGLVYEFIHKTLPLYGYSYSKKCTIENAWNDTTLHARGIIFDDKGNLVAFPFPKFFNLNQVNETRLENLPLHLPFSATVKEDGSLIIVFRYNGEWIAITKGSFYSEQALWASEFIKKNSIGDILTEIGDNNTYLFECIYPSNRIVVDYRGFEGLKFLGSYCILEKKETTHLVKPIISNSLHIPLSYDCSVEEILETVKGLKGIEQEGFVLRFSNGLRVKIKSEDYVKIHGIVTNITPLSVWENLIPNEEGLPLLNEVLLEIVPDEFHEKLLEYRSKLCDLYSVILVNGQSMFSDIIKMGIDRKDIYLYLDGIGRNDIAWLVFTLLDKKAYSAKIIKLIRPTGNVIEE